MIRIRKGMPETLLPVLLVFFIMGFVDITAIAVNYVKADFKLTDTVTNFFLSMVFIWFLLFSVPAGMLMDRIGRKNTVLLSIIITAISLIFPLIKYSLPMITISFSLLGISNTLMQVSLNPLLSDIVSENKFASSLTLGQSIKTIASLLGPIITGWAALKAGDWRIVCLLFIAIAVFGFIVLAKGKIEEEGVKNKASTFKECFLLLGDKIILLGFLGILCHVGIDVGVNVTAPKIIIEKFNSPLTSAGIASSIYFLFKMLGALAGSVVLAQHSAKKVFIISIFCLIIGTFGIFIAGTKFLAYIAIALIGTGNSNVFSIIFSQAVMANPEKKNKISGLMIMGVSGGALFPLLMGFASDITASQAGAVAVMSIGILYLICLIPKIKQSI